MYFEKFKDINDELISRLSNNDLNFARLILPSREGELTVIGKYTPTLLGDSFVKLDSELNPQESNDFGKFYYGVSPRLDNGTIINAMANGSLSSEERLEDFIKQHAEWFMLHKNQEKYLLAVAKYITVAVSCNYGIKIEFDSPDEAKKIFEDSKPLNTFLKLKKDEAVLTVRGYPLGNLLNILGKYRYIKKENNFVPSDSEDAITIEQIYSDKNNISLINGDVFYSGVLAKALKIEENESWHSNKGIVSMYLCYERSTYATVFALDNNFTDHPLLKNEKKVIVEFFEKDDRCKEENLTVSICEAAEGRERFIENVNKYLMNSYNVNQVGVTGNLMSAEGVLLYGKRAEAAIDAGKKYPGVNGNVEICDSDVDFYRDSLDVDKPTVLLDAPISSFVPEVSRETEAELNISVNNNLWKCCGIVVSGFIPKDKKDDEASASENEQFKDVVDYPYSYRRLHLNIIFNQRISTGFKDIRKSQVIAAEKYENREIDGILLKTYKNRFECFKSIFGIVLKRFLSWRTAITSIFTILLFFTSLSTMGFSLKDWSTRVSSFFAIVVVVTTVLDIIKMVIEKIKQSKYQHNFHIVRNKDIDEKLSKVLDKIFTDKEGFHPVAYVAVKLSLINTVYDDHKKCEKKKKEKQLKKQK